ncbi:MAG TPA: hypothetical protein VIX41_11480 [Acidimicrobiales bacterium]
MAEPPLDWRDDPEWGEDPKAELIGCLYIVLAMILLAAGFWLLYLVAADLP